MIRKVNRTAGLKGPDATVAIPNVRTWNASLQIISNSYSVLGALLIWRWFLKRYYIGILLIMVMSE